MKHSFDVIVVGAGIVGLAHAWSAARRGLRVAVVERNARCVGASIRNFGFVTVTGQAAGATWQRARHSREVWAEIAPQAGIEILHRGLWVLAQRPAARDVLEAFAATDMGADCVLHTAGDAAALMPALRTEAASAALYSPHELRVESRTAVPRLAAWLAQSHGVVFHTAETVLQVEPRGDAVHLVTSRRALRAERVVICPGSELTGVAAQALAPHAPRLSLCKLHMLRVRPEEGFRLGAAVMGDLSLVRYLGYASLPAARVLRDQLEAEVPDSLAHGIHLIVVQSADGTLVVGDSHHDAALNEDTPDPFAPEAVDALILRHLRETLQLERCEVVERWTGIYPSHPDTPCLIESPDPALRVVVVTSGTGASTAFGIADEVFSTW